MESRQTAWLNSIVPGHSGRIPPAVWLFRTENGTMSTQKQYPSIFNHALAPVTAGPSSSNTSGPYRIGWSVRQLAGETPARLEMDLAASTSYARTFLGGRSDLALINGLLGKEATDPRFVDAYADAESAGLSISFDTMRWPGTGTLKGHRMFVTGRNGDQLVVIADSPGGGTIRLMEIDGCEVDIRGEHHELLVFTEKLDAAALESLASRIASRMSLVNGTGWTVGKGACSLVEIRSAEPAEDSLIEELKGWEGVARVRTLAPVNAVVANKERRPPFHGAEEMLAYTEKTGRSLWQAAVDYESALSGWSGREVFEYARKLWRIIEASVEEGLKGGFDMNGIVTPRAGALLDQLTNKPRLPMGMLDLAVPVSLGVMEYSNASGAIVCIPTGGSSGIVPGAICGAAEHLGSDEDRKVEALLAAGIVGVCMGDGNNFMGGEFGCQAEVGCGAAMAAGALVQMLDGTPRQACDAASMALQCLLGLVCDPVAGLVQVPCLARNMGSTAVAVVSANAVMAGFDVAVPLQDMFEAMKTVGRIICKSHGIGTTTTAAGLRMKEEQAARDKALRRRGTAADGSE